MMNQHVALIQNKSLDALAAIGFQTADERNPLRVAMFLHSIHAHGKNPEEKLSLLTTSFTDLTLRKIGTQSAEFAQELREEYQSSRKASRKSQPTITALQKAQELKRNLASVIKSSPVAQPLHFLTPKKQGTQHSNFSDDNLQTDVCVGLCAPRNLSGEFEQHSATPTQIQRDNLAARLEQEALNCEISEDELRNAEEILRRERSYATDHSQTFSVRSENEALENLFKTACVLILKHSAHEDVTRFYKRGTTQFDWGLNHTDSRLSLDRLTEQFRNSSYTSLSPHASAQAACVKFVTDLSKFEWLLGLYNSVEGVETAVKTFKNLLGSRIESLLQPHEMFLKSNALDNHEIRRGNLTSFDFYKQRLNVITPHEKSKSVNFLFEEKRSPPSFSPGGMVRNIHTRDSRPISGNPAGECYHEQRTDKNERSTETISKFRIGRPGTPIPTDKQHRVHSDSEPDPWESNPDIATSGDESDRHGRSRSRSRDRDHRRPKAPTAEPLRRSTRNVPEVNSVIRFIEKTIAKAIENKEAKSAHKRPREASRSPGRPVFNQRQPRAPRECRPPHDACAAFAQGLPCTNPACNSNHGYFYTSTPEGVPTRPCEFESQGQPCPYVWMRSGCFFKHSVANTKNVKAAYAAKPSM